MEALASTRSVSSVARTNGRTLGWAVFAATTVCCAAAFALDLYTGNYRTLAYVVAGQTLALMGLLLTTRLPLHPVSWVFAISAAWSAIGTFAQAYAVEALVHEPGSLPGGLALAWLDNWAWAPGLSLPLCALLLLMPDGRLLSRSWRLVPVIVVVGTVLTAGAVSATTNFELAGTMVPNPLASETLAVGVAGATGAILVVAGLIASLAALVVRYRRSEEDARQQLRWVAVAFGCATVLTIAGALLWGVVPGAAALPALALLALPAGVAVAVLKYRLYELDLVVNRAAVYVLLTVAVVASYILVVGVVGAYLSHSNDLVLSLVVTGVVAVGFQPLRERLQRFVNRLMYGDRGDPYAALAGLGRTLARSLQGEAALRVAAETIARTLALQYAALTVGGDVNRPAREVASYGSPGEDITVVPLVHQGAPVGELRLATRAGERLRERDHRLIADLAPQVAAAAHAVALSQQLQAARRRLIELREEERLRIRRDLHDGLGPSLAGLTFTLDAVRNVANSDPERSDELLASATTQLQTMIGDVRRLIYGLRPPALDQLGLAAALRELARHEEAGPTRFEMQAPDSLPPLEAAVEVAAYWIVQEALTNVARHAHARRCTLRLSVEQSALVLEVVDDGHGFSQQRTGVGLQAMRERAAELGGTCEIASESGAGTIVSVRLPREAEAEVAG